MSVKRPGYVRNSLTRVSLGRAHDSGRSECDKELKARDEALDAFVAGLEGVLAQDGALGLVVEL